MNYLKTNLKNYINSLKNKQILVALPLNILFLVIMIATTKAIQALSQKHLEKIRNMDLSNIAMQTQTQLQNKLSTLRGFALFAALSVLLFIIILIISWSLTQGKIYSYLLKKKYNLKFIEKFIILNLVWFIPWLIILAIILFGAKTEYLIESSATVILLFLHFSFILYIIFTKNNTLKSIPQALKTGTIKLHKLFPNYILITITFLIISQINLFNPHPYILAFILLAFISWTQVYLKEITVKLV